MAKDETEIGITGLPIPKKKRSPAKQYKFEKERRKNLGPNVGGTSIRSDVTPNYNPRGRTFEEFMMIVSEAKVDKMLPDHQRSAARLARYDNPSGALKLGGGQQRARRAEHEQSRGKKKKSSL